MKKVKVSYANPLEPQKGISVVMDMGFYSRIEKYSRYDDGVFKKYVTDFLGHNPPRKEEIKFTYNIDSETRQKILGCLGCKR